MISAYLSVALSREHRPALLEKGIFLRPSEEGLKEPVDKTCRIAVAYRHPYRLLAVIRLAPTKARPVFENSVLEGVLQPRVCRHFSASKHECPLSDGIIGFSGRKIHALDRRSFFTKIMALVDLPELELPAIFLAEQGVTTLNLKRNYTNY